jgi:uncharacterized SAM-binding protein YcdF (DUF218 family)
MLTEREVFIVLVDNDLIQPSDAIILLEGDGMNRYRHAAELYNKEFSRTIVFSGGIINYEYGSYPFEDIKPFLLKEGIPESSIIHESKSLNTKQQSIEIMNLCKINNWNKIVLVGSHYHQYRAYLTFLKSMYDSQLKINIFNSPARDLKWFSENDWGSRFSCLQKEFDRIDYYSKLGHLATYKEAIEYQKWKEEQL